MLQGTAEDMTSGDRTIEAEPRFRDAMFARPQVDRNYAQDPSTAYGSLRDTQATVDNRDSAD